MAKIIGVVLIGGDIYWVYHLGFNDVFSNFWIAIAIVIVAVIGAILLIKG